MMTFLVIINHHTYSTGESSHVYSVTHRVIGNVLLNKQMIGHPSIYTKLNVNISNQLPRGIETQQSTSGREARGSCCRDTAGIKR